MFLHLAGKSSPSPSRQDDEELITGRRAQNQNSRFNCRRQCGRVESHPRPRSVCKLSVLIKTEIEMSPVPPPVFFFSSPDYTVRHPSQLLKSSHFFFFQLPRFPELMLSINDFKVGWHAGQGQAWMCVHFRRVGVHLCVDLFVCV